MTPRGRLELIASVLTSSGQGNFKLMMITITLLRSDYLN